MAPPLGLKEMPLEILQEIAGHASPVDRIELAFAHPRALYRVIAEEARAARITITDAPGVTTLAGFRALLGNGARSIQGLDRKPLRGEPLAALGARIPRLPANDQQPAIDAFLASAQDIPGPRPALLDALMRAAANGPGGLATREREAVAFDGPATVAVEDGENVQAVAQRHGISGPAAITRLERVATFGPAWRAVKGGEDVRVVAQRHGITDPEAIARLTEKAARVAVRGGENVQVAAQRYRITDPEAIADLERAATFGPALDAVKGGEDVRVVAQRHGISSPANIARLTTWAASAGR